MRRSTIARLVERLHRTLFRRSWGLANQRRYSNQSPGRHRARPVGRPRQGAAVSRCIGCLGGAVRDEIADFGFVQGDGPDEVGDACPRARRAGVRGRLPQGRPRRCAGRRERARRCAAAIGGRRLRVDANEAWDTLTARRMIAQLTAVRAWSSSSSPRPPTAPPPWPGSAGASARADRGRPAGARRRSTCSRPAGTRRPT